MNYPFIFLVGWGRGGFACACVLGFILEISNKVILYALQTYLHVLPVFVSFGMAETKDGIPLKLKV